MKIVFKKFILNERESRSWAETENPNEKNGLDTWRGWYDIDVSTNFPQVSSREVKKGGGCLWGTTQSVTARQTRCSHFTVKTFYFRDELDFKSL